LYGHSAAASRALECRAGFKIHRDRPAAVRAPKKKRHEATTPTAHDSSGCSLSLA